MRDEQNEAREAFATVDWPAQTAAWTEKHRRERARETAATIERYEDKIARAYTAVALLADKAGLYLHPQVQAALDFFCDPAAPDTGWSFQDYAIEPGTEWQGEPADYPAPVDVMAYWG